MLKPDLADLASLSSQFTSIISECLPGLQAHYPIVLIYICVLESGCWACMASVLYTKSSHQPLSSLLVLLIGIIYFGLGGFEIGVSCNLGWSPAHQVS